MAVCKKTIWIIHQEGSTPDTGMGGRHYYLGEELAKLGYKVYLIVASYCHTMRKPPLIKDKFLIEKREDNFYFVWVKVPPYKGAHSKQRVINWFLFAWRIQLLKKYLTGVKPDTILCTSPPLVPFLGARRLAKYFNTKLVFEVRDIWPLTLIELGGYSSFHPFIMLMQWIERRAYRDAEIVISNLKYSVEHMQSKGMNPSKFYWIPNGFSLTEVSHQSCLPKKIAAQLPSNKFLIGYAGTLGLANCLEHFIQAAYLLRNNSEISFVLVGEGDYKDKLKQEADDLNLNNVHFIDAVPKAQVQAVLACFDVCYISLKKQNLFKYGVSPNKLFDYFYSGKPIIYGVDSGRYRPVHDNQAGIEIEPENPEAIKEAILQLFEMPAEQRNELGYNGKNFVLEQYEYGNLAEKLGSIL